ncbi:MAG: ATP-binding cassette domain-containing protein, partial [Luteolibacter sp.]
MKTDQPISAMHVVVRDAWKSFDRGRIEVLRGIDIEVAHGEVVALLGSSGCGKSTLLNVISGLEPIDRGEVRVDGRTVGDESTRIGLLRHHIGYVFQLHHLMPDLTLRENCLVPVVAARGDRKKGMERL